MNYNQYADAEKRRPIIEERLKDWRQHQVVYQILVDRFNRSKHFEKKRDLYKHPYTLHEWNENARPGEYRESVGYWSHELAFWGGDLQGVIAKLAYIKSLGINTLYFNPIFESFSNHKYDTCDYFKIDPQFGSINDLKELVKKSHLLKINIVLDGVFNHVGMTSTWFSQAKADPNSPYRDYFTFSDQETHGYKAWWNVKNLPELNIEHPKVQDIIITGEHSVIKSYLRDAGVDGWRLDVACDLGPDLLRLFTNSAHECKEKSLIVGENWNYPGEWTNSMDGVLNFYARQLIFQFIHGLISPNRTGKLIAQMIEDSNIEGILKSWLVLSNHDTPRLKTIIPDNQMREIALCLQFTLPGSPVVYYGDELGMSGGIDPSNRNPMNWNECHEHNSELALYKKFITLRNEQIALQVGDFMPLETDNLLSFARVAAYLEDLVIVIINPKKIEVVETLSIPDYRLMAHQVMKEVFTGEEAVLATSMITVSMPPKSYKIFKPVIKREGGHTPYKRVR